MRVELAELVRTRYGESGIETAVLLSPDDKQVNDYTRHNGMLSFWVNLARDPGLVIVDTQRLLHLDHAWIANQKPDNIRLVLASDNHPVTERVLRMGTFIDRRIEGLELTIHYGPSHRREVPYTAELKPLW